MLRHLSGSTLVQPTLVVALALGSLYASFICFAQSVRLYVHTVSCIDHMGMWCAVVSCCTAVSCIGYIGMLGCVL